VKSNAVIFARSVFVEPDGGCKKQNNKIWVTGLEIEIRVLKTGKHVCAEDDWRMTSG
jgi:hypothetical protein